MSELSPPPDPEVDAFEQALLRSMDEARRGEHARISTPEAIVARLSGIRDQKNNRAQSARILI
jgi:hypothetical protein